MSHGHGHAAGEGASKESVAVGYEVADAKRRPLVLAIISVFALLALSFALIGGLLFVAGGQAGDRSNALSATSAQLPIEPRLEQNPELDGTRIVSEATQRLASFGWVQQRDGVAHIPIERSMELLVERGISPFEK